MNIQQIRAVREATRADFNLTDVADMLHTSQSGISRQIRELEVELGIEIFVRHGKRLTGLTSPGAKLLPMIERMLLEVDNIKRAGSNLSAQHAGPLSIAATHSQARYALPAVVRDFCAIYPDVELSLHQGSPQQVAGMLLSGEADIGIATEALAGYERLTALPCYRWTHSVILPPGHALLATDAPLTLSALAGHPIVTYQTGYTGRSHIDKAFAAQGIEPNIVLTAMDADVIKTYVELGLGIGIVASIAFDAERDRTLRSLDAGHLFEVNVTRLAVLRNAWLPDYAYAFIELFAPTLTRGVVEDHGGDAADQVVETLDDRGSPDRAPAYLRRGDRKSVAPVIAPA